MPLNNPFEVPLPQPTNFEVTSNQDIPVSLFNTGTNLLPQTTSFILRTNNPDPSPNPLNTFGIPGSNFIGQQNATPILYQGEDAIFDTYLYIDGQNFSTNNYVLYAIVKPSQYFVTNYWEGTLGNGIYADPNNISHFVIFIPNTITSTWLAGTLELDVYAVQNVSSSIDIKPRTLLVGKTYFDVEYAAFSPNPESIESGAPNLRNTLQNSYPPAFNTASDGAGYNSDPCDGGILNLGSSSSDTGAVTTADNVAIAALQAELVTANNMIASLQSQITALQAAIASLE